MIDGKGNQNEGGDEIPQLTTRRMQGRRTLGAG